MTTTICHNCLSPFKIILCDLSLLDYFLFISRISTYLNYKFDFFAYNFFRPHPNPKTNKQKQLFEHPLTFEMMSSCKYLTENGPTLCTAVFLNDLNVYRCALIIPVVF